MRPYFILICLVLVCLLFFFCISGNYRVIKKLLPLTANSVAERHAINRLII